MDDCGTATKGSHMVGGKCTEDDPAPPAPGGACKADADCTDATLNKCDATSGQCYPTGAKANGDCADKTTKGMSLTLGGECAGDCMDLVKGEDATASVPGMHNDATDKNKCIQDTPVSTDDKTNNGCTPVKTGSSVNATAQTCDADCKTATKGSHDMAGECIADTAKPNAACATAKDNFS